MDSVDRPGTDPEPEGRNAEGIVVDLSGYEPLLSMEDLGRVLHCEPRTARRWIDREELPFTTRGRSVLISRTLVQRRLEEQMRATRRTGRNDR